MYFIINFEKLDDLKNAKSISLKIIEIKPNYLIDIK